jgi:glycosyltransferase involved in cell wall biosynthesis
VPKIYAYRGFHPVGALKKPSFSSILKKTYRYFASSFFLLKILKSKKNFLVIGNNTGDIVYSLWTKILGDKFILFIHDIIPKKGILKFALKLFVGNLEPRKDPILFLEIVRTFAKQGLLKEAKMAYKYAESELLDIIKEKIDSDCLDVELLGNVDREAMGNLYREVDFLVVTSREDPFPTVILEALASGTPVVGRRVGGIPEMIEHGVSGYLFDSPSDLKPLIRSIRDGSLDWCTLSKNAYRTVKKRFPIDKKIALLDGLIAAEAGWKSAQN